MQWQISRDFYSTCNILNRVTLTCGTNGPWYMCDEARQVIYESNFSNGYPEAEQNITGWG